MKHKGLTIHLMLVVVLALLLAPAGIVGAQEPDKGPHPMNVCPHADAEVASIASAVISNGTVSLGVNDLGYALHAGVGLRYLPTGGEVLWVGCYCEGWGAADATSGIQGWASIDNGGVVNVTPVSFVSTSTTATSVTTVGGILRVTHDFHPSPATPYLYEIDVTIDNISGAPVDLRYTRDQDWDVPPTHFNEFVTIQGTAAEPTVLYADNNGFQTPGPLFSRSSFGAVGDFVDFGPTDQGSLFDFGFGIVAAGTSVKFTIFYGAAGTEADALAAIAAVGATVYSLGQPNVSGGPNLGVPNTFIFAYLQNEPPVANPSVPYLGAAGSPIAFDGSGSSDPDGDTLTYDWDWGDSSSSPNAGATPSHSYSDAGIYDVCLTVTDPGGLSDTECTYVVVYDPSAGFVTGGGWIDSPAGAYYPAPLSFFDGSYYQLVSAPGITWDAANAAANAMTLVGCDYPHLVTITSQEEQDALYEFFDGELQGKWYGGFQEPGVVPADFGWQWVTGEPWNYTNWAPGEPNDADGPASEQHLEGWIGGTEWNDEAYLGFVTGYVVEYDDCLTGKANFGFVSKYKKGAEVPTGNTEFQLHAADLNFHISSYEWLVVTGSNYARFKGAGTINGMGDYKFMLWAGDGTGTDGADTFRIKIWEKDEFGVETVIYDNGFGQAIGGGSIVIHKK